MLPVRDALFSSSGGKYQSLREEERGRGAAWVHSADFVGFFFFILIFFVARKAPERDSSSEQKEGLMWCSRSLRVCVCVLEALGGVSPHHLLGGGSRGDRDAKSGVTVRSVAG